MYLSMQNFFFVPIFYVKEDIFNTQKMVLLQECNSDDDFINDTIQRKETIIGVSFPTLREQKWIRDKEAMEKYAQEKGVTLKIENADASADKQSSQVDNLISQGIDVLILAPVDSVAAAALVEKAKNAGIKVINYDKFIVNSDSDLFVAFNTIRVGELQGRYLTQTVPKGNYIIMTADPKDENSKLYKEGALEYIQPLIYKRDIKIVTDKPVDNWDPKNAFKIVQDSLAANDNNINAILAPNDATAGAAIQALKAQDLAGKVAVTGMDGDLDAIQRIIQGTQSMTVLKDSRELGKAAIDSAIKLAQKQGIDINATVNNGKIDVPSILLTPISVDKSTIDQDIIKSGYYTKEQVYKK